MNVIFFFSSRVVIGELIETEDEFARDIQKVVDKYLNPLEEETRPASRCVMDNKEIIFNNLRQIATFHKGYIDFSLYFVFNNSDDYFLYTYSFDKIFKNEETS